MDGFDIGPVHLFEELPGIGGQRFDIASLTFCEEGIEGKTRLSRARDTCNDRDFASWYSAGYIFEVMGPCANDLDELLHHIIII
jgi:hypothetical protein